jgi:hypothetical protein
VRGRSAGVATDPKSEQAVDTLRSWRWETEKVLGVALDLVRDHCDSLKAMTDSAFDDALLQRGSRRTGVHI